MLDENTLRRIEFLPSFGDPCGDQTSRGDVVSRSLNLLYRVNCKALYPRQIIQRRSISRGSSTLAMNRT